jgi:hypothetical protein
MCYISLKLGIITHNIAKNVRFPIKIVRLKVKVGKFSLKQDR